jgi:CRP-like cAMP-binding protein
MTNKADQPRPSSFAIEFERRELEALLRAGRTRSLPPSAILCEDGQLASHCYVVTRGTVEVTKSIEGVSHVLSKHGPGSILALMATLDGGPCRVSLRAGEKEEEDTTVLEVGRDALVALLHAGFNPDFGSDDACVSLAEKMTITAIRRLRAATDELAQAIHRSIITAKRPGHLGIPDLATIHAGNHAWKAAA